MKIAINIDTDEKTSREQLIRLAITVYRFNKSSSKKIDDKIHEAVLES